MPVTAKLSKAFYDKMGDQVATELVEWFNNVDAAYRGDLRELNELNFARFDAKVEQRFAQSDAKWERRFAESDVKLERRFAESDAKLEQRFAQSDAKWEHRFAQIEARLTQFATKADLAQLEVRIERRFGEQTRWLFAMWATVIIALLGLYLRH